MNQGNKKEVGHPAQDWELLAEKKKNEQKKKKKQKKSTLVVW